MNEIHLKNYLVEGDNMFLVFELPDISQVKWNIKEQDLLKSVGAECLIKVIPGQVGNTAGE